MHPRGQLRYKSNNGSSIKKHSSILLFALHLLNFAVWEIQWVSNKRFRFRNDVHIRRIDMHTKSSIRRNGTSSFVRRTKRSSLSWDYIKRHVPISFLDRNCLPQCVFAFENIFRVYSRCHRQRWRDKRLRNFYMIWPQNIYCLYCSRELQSLKVVESTSKHCVCTLFKSISQLF